jgi:putative heme-binding domain-containing protein
MSGICAVQFALVLVAVWAANGLAVWSQTPGQDLPKQNVKLDSTRGKQVFASTCANCHGLDGSGSERAPNIVERASVQRLSDAQISHIIENGVPGSGMPAFHSLEHSDVEAIVAYLRALQGRKPTVKLPGNPDRGEAVFFGKAGCSGCHMIAGKGGFIASDLSEYAGSRGVDQIRSAITAPNSNGARLARLVTAMTRSGEKYSGRIRNEDNFSLQLQALDGTFYFVAKSEIERLEYSSQSLMPSDYDSTLSHDDLNDVVSYLMRVAHVSSGAAKAPVEAFEPE